MKISKVTIPISILAVTLLLVFPNVSLSQEESDEEKIPLEIMDGYVTGAHYEFEPQYIKSAKDEIVSAAVKPFDKSKYEYINEHELEHVMKYTDAFGYPIMDNAIRRNEMAEKQKEAEIRISGEDGSADKKQDEEVIESIKKERK